jgi:PAS domain-containing protein
VRRSRFLTIPSSDSAFAEHVDRLRAQHPRETPVQLERRLRALFPRVVVRERTLSGEDPTWYVYRDGAWRSSFAGPWWTADGLPMLSFSSEGWILQASPAACDLLAVPSDAIQTHHFTDFIAPGTLSDASAMFQIVAEGRDLTATVLLRPTSGDVIAIDIHAARREAAIEIVMRLADDVTLPEPTTVIDRPNVICVPATDVAFAGYVDLALSRMPEPAPEGLALRLRRLYPHARVSVDEARWIATRDLVEPLDSDWWLEPDLPTVRYDAQALILEANDAAVGMLGRPMVGRYWQEFVTPGSAEQVAAMLAILAATGGAESRFRIPDATGALVEFDSYTSVDGEAFVTVIRPINSRVGDWALRRPEGIDDQDHRRSKDDDK